jgi:hypothetical protein
MATIKQEADDAAGECGVALASSWLGSSEDALTCQRFIRAISRDIIDRHEWVGASSTVTLSAASTTSVFALPANLDRIQKNEKAVYDVSSRSPVMPVNNDSDWQEKITYGISGACRYYRRVSEGIEFFPALPAGSSVKLSYVSNNWIKGGKSDWTDEATDTPIFPSQLIRFGLIYRWRRQKGLRFQDEQAEYEAILARAMANDRPSSNINFGHDSFQRKTNTIPFIEGL